jgi:hypothetical protein
MPVRENPLLWNLMWPIVGLSDGSFYFDNQLNMLNQFLINKNMATGDAPLKADPTTMQISNCRAWSIQVFIRSQSHSAEWVSRSIKTDSPISFQSP